MRESLIFSFLCQCLQQFDKKRHLSQQHKAIQNLKPDWYQVTSLADTHYVLPSLYYQLQEKRLLQFLPEDIQISIADIYTLNRSRNDRIRREIHRIAGLLNPAGIEPVFIKGSAAMLMDLYDEPGLRIMGDVDLLLRKNEILTCTELMRSVGYAPIEGLYLPDADGHYHGFPLVHDNHSIRFEIHERLANDPVLESESIINDSVQIQIKDRVVRIPSKEHFAINNILHHQVYDGGMENEELLLYQLLDLYTIREKYERQLDWKAVGAFFTDHSLQEPFCFSMDMLKKYFNQRIPGKIPFSLNCRIRYRQNRNRFQKLIQQLKFIQPE